MRKKAPAIILAIILAAALAACGSNTATENTETQAVTSSVSTVSAVSESNAGSSASKTEAAVTTANVTADGAIDASSLFTERDLTQTAALSEAEYLTVKDGEDITITAAGVYVISGTSGETTIIVEAGDEDKVQLVLDGVSITNTDFPCIYVKNADKVFVTTAEGTENTLTVTGTFTADGTTNTDAVIFSRDDLVINGLGTLTVSSTDNGIACKDDLKITGGTLTVDSVEDALEANESISMAAGTVTLKAGEDGMHAENDEDDTVGSVYLCGGTLTITAGDDAVHAHTILQVDDGDITITAGEGLEATWVQINGGTINISASDDGINGAAKSSLYTPTVEINGGYITINMGAGDTDAVDANGYIYMNGGTLDITAQSPFDYDMGAQYNGGTIIVNGVETNAITSQMMGGRGGMNGQGTQGGPWGRR